MSTEDHGDAFAIVGAGPAGLVTARAFMNYGLEVDLYERHSAIGGIWDIENPGSPLYRSCHFISSRDYGAFFDFPMPREYPMYPKWHQIRDYIRSFAEHYGIEEKVRFNSNVVGVAPVETDSGERWQLTLENGEAHIYRGVISAGGGQWKPVIPHWPGEERFRGTIIHSSEYHDPSELEGKTVLVVGAGNSGVDIAADASQRAERAFLTTRRGYWFLPKLAYGRPVGDLLQGLIPDEELPAPLRGRTPPEIIALVMESVIGDVTNYGLPEPDHEFGQTHPITNFEVIHALGHGTLEYRRNLERFTDTGAVFSDGREEQIDLVILATGYDLSLPWIDEELVDRVDEIPQFHLGTLVQGAQGLYGAGVLHFAGNTFPVFDQFIQVAAAEASALVNGEDLAKFREIREELNPSFKEDDTFLDVRRNANHVDIAAVNRYFETLEARFGIPVPSFAAPGFYAALEERLRARAA